MKNKLMKMTTMIILALAMILSTISVAAVEVATQPGKVEAPEGDPISKAEWTKNPSGTITVSGIVPNDTVEVYKVIDITYDENTNQVKKEWVSEIKELIEDNSKRLSFSTMEDYVKNDENAKELYEFVMSALSNGKLEMLSIATIQADPDESGDIKINISEMGQYMIFGKGVNVYAPMTATFEPTLKEINGKNEYVYYNQIKIEAKASSPTVDKKIVPINKGQEINSENTDSVAIEDWVNYNLNVTAPFFPEKAVDKTFVLRDTMEKGLKGVSGITITADDGTVLDGVPLTGTQFAEIHPDLTGYDYGVKYYEDTQFNGEAEALQAGSFEIIFNMDSEKVNGKAKLVVDYDSKVTELMKPSEEEGDGEDNTVTLIWPKNVWKTASDYTVVPPEGQEDDYNREDDTVTVFTYGLVVTKTDEKTNKPLEGAVFNLYKDGVEEPIRKGLTTGSDGTFTIIGLDEGKYVLKETKAPDGYVLLNENVEFEIKGAVDENGELTGYLTSKQGTNLYTSLASIGVANKPGFNLPKTGGAGTAIFTILGVVLMGGALLLVVRMRKANGAK